MRRLLFILLFLVLFLVACTTSAQEIKTGDFEGETVTVKGEAENAFRLGDLSGYNLRDNTGVIFVSTTDLPENGETVRVRGEVKRVLGMNYLDAND